MSARTILNELARSVVDFIYPPVCHGCGVRLDSELVLCGDCLRTLETTVKAYSPPSRTLSGIDRVSVLLPYDELARTLIHALKYHGISSLGLPLGRLMASHYSDIADDAMTHPPVMLPVPLHPGKYRSRGYNQSERLATGFAVATGLAVDDTLLVRTRDTGTQTALDADSRAHNVAGAFRLRDGASVAGRRFVIIDDVLTTGSTVAACAQVLRDSGAAGIDVCVVASPEVGED